ncbi:MAG: hypothetical protein QF546_03475 [Alphaproteobacteria bacterium]|jgi:hypothetical protein|nr:hypothetical protein [Alphaproteobacteria bacterium]HJP20898.1 hypothetical protein [Alphaproteobacteria bacterium]
MPLLGQAFLAIWNDVTPGWDDEFNLWHTREHIPERVGVKGFLRGRRYVDWQAERQRYFMLYEAEDLEVFRGPDYLKRLNNPSPWTQQVMPEFLNFVRGACRPLVSGGLGVGGAMATLRFSQTSAGEKLVGLAPDLLDLPGVTAVHVGLAEDAVTNQTTNERKMRAATDDRSFAALALIEGLGRLELTAQMPTIQAAVAELPDGAPEIGLYDAAFILDGT